MTRLEAPDACAASADLSVEQARDLVSLIRQELATLRREVRINQHLQAWNSRGAAAMWVDAMADVAMPAALRTLLLPDLVEIEDRSTALSHIKQQLAASLSNADAGTFDCGVHLLFGPSGAGKTSMAARLAQQAASRLGAHRVALVSLADQRPGAWGQLQLLGARIGVDVFRAADAATLQLLLTDIGDDKVVFIDHGAGKLEALTAMSIDQPLNCHLVVAGDASAASVQRWTATGGPAWRSLMLTRIDQSCMAWPVLQVMGNSGLPLSAISQGEGLGDLALGLGAQGLLEMGIEQLAKAFEERCGSQAQQQPQPQPQPQAQALQAGADNAPVAAAALCAQAARAVVKTSSSRRRAQSREPAHVQ